MTSVQTGMSEYQQFIGGEWTPGEGGTFEDRDPFTGDVVATAPAGTRADARARDRGCGRGVPGLVADRPGRAAADLPKAADVLESRLRRGRRRCSRARPAATFGFGMFQMGFVPGPAPPGGGARLRADRRRSSRRTPGTLRDGAPPAGRRRRRDRAVERRADPLGALDRRAARARQHGRAEAVGVVARRRRAALGRDLRRGRPAGRRAEHRHARARARPAPIGDELVENPRRAPHQLHRLDGRPAGGSPRRPGAS